MRFPCLIFIFFSIFLAAHVHAEQNTSELPPSVPPEMGTVIARVIFPDSTPAANAPLFMLVRSGNSTSVLRLITDQNGQVLLSLGPGRFELDTLLDYYNTSGIDFASTASIDASTGQNATLILYPAGSVSGSVSLGGSPGQRPT